MTYEALRICGRSHCVAMRSPYGFQPMLSAVLGHVINMMGWVPYAAVAVVAHFSLKLWMAIRSLLNYGTLRALTWCILTTPM